MAILWLYPLDYSFAIPGKALFFQLRDDIFNYIDIKVCVHHQQGAAQNDLSFDGLELGKELDDHLFDELSLVVIALVFLASVHLACPEYPQHLRGFLLVIAQQFQQADCL